MMNECRKGVKKMAAPLEGIRVVDVTQFAAGPMAARLLGDWGADVIHVEHPVKGDAQRYIQSRGGGFGKSTPHKINYIWDHVSRNKKSVTLDLAQERGREILYKLAETADVFVTNMKLPDVRKFGLEYEPLSQLNPRLIYGSLNGYGNNGPDKDYPGFDGSSYFARAGISHMLSQPQSYPPCARPTLGDFPAGLGLAYGIVVALFCRERTGIGQAVEASLYRAGVFALSHDLVEALTTGHEPERIPRNEVTNPLVNFYKTKDERYLRLSIVQPDLYWSKFCQALGREDLEHDPRFESFEPRTQNHAALIKILDEVFATRTLAEWKPHLDTAAPWSPVQNLLEVAADPQSRANDFFLTFNDPQHGPVEVIANPVKLSKTPETIRALGPEFSQHTEEVLLEIGYTWEDIDQFKQQGVIA